MSPGKTVLHYLDPLYGHPARLRSEFRQWNQRSRIPLVRPIAFLTALLYLIYAYIEYRVGPGEVHTQALLVRGLVLPLALVTIGLMTYRERLHRYMWCLLMVAPVGATAGNLYLSTQHGHFALYAPELYLILVWVFTVSGLMLRHATMTAMASAALILTHTGVVLLEPRVVSLHLFWMLSAFSFGIVTAVMLEKSSREMFLQQRQLERSATVDSLTGLWNRYKIEGVLEREVARAARYGNSLSTILLDIDRFKSVNDTYGHAAGDLLLREFAQVLRDSVREVDEAGRLGGEEFLVVLPETDASSARTLAEALRQRIAGTPFSTAGQCTASLGVAQYQPGESPLALITRADQALYRAKAAGRNRVRLA